MTNNEDPNSENLRNEEEIKQNAEEAGKLLNQDEKTNPVKHALIKENNPTSADDLSALHNTHEVGTSGGDQRAPDTKPDEDPANPKTPVPVEEPAPNKGDTKPAHEDPDNEPKIHTRK